MYRKKDWKILILKMFQMPVNCFMVIEFIKNNHPKNYNYVNSINDHIICVLKKYMTLDIKTKNYPTKEI